VGLMDLSIVIPAFNEEKNVSLVHERLKDVLSQLKYDYEIIFVNDGSTDCTKKELLKLYSKYSHVRVIDFKCNFGQTAALAAGFKYARGKVIITLDADLQNDPCDIPRFIDTLNQGYDVVCGWRYKRKDSLSKKMFSRIAAYLRRKLTGDMIHDSGCSLKAFKKECFNDLVLYGEMHRFIPTLLRWKGFKITELKVKHHFRKYGKTKYGMGRIFRGSIDLMNAKFFGDYFTRPLHFFAKVSFFCLFFGFALISYNLLRYGLSLAVGPTLLAAILFILIAIQLFGLGFLGEILIKLYFDRKENVNYNIEKIYSRK
jgi:glycosyltransferase involved in cell wall biosynthesis